MENKFFQKAKLATAIALVSSTTLLTGCLVDGDRSNSVTTSSTAADPANNFERVANPVGTVVGLVQDIQGNPISGATVSIAGRTTTTTSAGTYQFTDIPVTDVVANASTSTASANESNAVLGNSPALMVSIQPPAGYLGATVTVTAPASVIDYGADDNCTDSNAGSTVTCAANANTHSFIDGFLAQAGTAVLPALNATVTGTLRDDDTGVALANTEITLEMIGTYLSGVSLEDVVLLANSQNGTQISYAVGNVVTTTDEEGRFTFTNVPSKSALLPRVAGYILESVQENEVNISGDDAISTADWTSGIEVGEVAVSRIIPNADTEAPYVTRVDSVTDGIPGLFNDDIDVSAAGTGLVVHFSEPLADSVDAATLENSVEVLVWNDTGDSAGDAKYDSDEFDSGEYATIDSIALSADRTSMTIVLDDNVTEGQSLHVNMLKVDFTDIAGNRLVVSGAVDYDFTVSTSDNNVGFVRLEISTFVDINKGAPAVDAQQFAEDDSGVNLYQAVTDISSVFIDVNDSDDEISNLNATDDNGVSSGEVNARLTALHTAIGGTATAIDSDQALIKFTPNEASGYIIQVRDELGNDVTAYGNITDLSGNVFTTLNAGTTGDPISLTDSNEVALVLNAVEAGWTVAIIPVDDLGYAFGTPNTTTLADLVPPTTVLQKSYLAVGTTDYLVTGETFGEGGELVNEGAATGGTPILNITAQLLDNLDGDGVEALSISDNDDTLTKELTANNTVNATTGSPYITTGYDDAAFAVLAGNAGRKIGVAFSENIAATATTPSFDASNNATLSGWSVLNDVNKDSDDNDTSVDLMTFDVDDVFALASDNGEVIDFTDDVTDTAATPNAAVAATNARVIVRDALPPFIVSGTYNGDTLILEFNEEIVPQDEDEFVFSDATSAELSVFPENGDLTAVNYTLQSVNGGTNNQITIQKEAWGDDLALATAFALPAYSGTNEHGLITFLDIEDTNENNWTDNAYGITPIPFALLAGVDPVMSIDSITATGSGTGTATVTVTTSHRVATYTNPLSNADVTAILGFTDSGAATTADFTAASGTVSADGRTLVMTIPTSAGTYDAGDNFAASGLVSDWDATQTATSANDDI